MTNKLLYVNIINSDDICIHSLAFSNCGQYLAASYSNNVCIFETRTTFLLTTLNDRDVDASFRSIIWIPLNYSSKLSLSDYRLFTVGLHGIITEWDLQFFKPKISTTSFGGAIFSGVSTSDSDLLVACDDGSVRCFSLWDDHKFLDRTPELNFKRVLLRHNKPVLSLCCLDDGRFFCGTSDSLILVCSIDKDNHVNVMRVSPKKSDKRRRNDNSDCDNLPTTQLDNTHVWCLVHISGTNTLASGDSNGNVILWDLSTLTMAQMFTQHNNDVIALSTISDGTLFSAGLDGKVVLYSNNTNIENGTGPNHINDFKSINENGHNRLERWSVSGFKYPLKGDIRTMKVNPSNDLVVVAGNFGCISICRVHKFLSYKKSKHKLVYPNIWPFYNVVSTNTLKNLALCKHTYHCDLWFIPTSNYDFCESSECSSIDHTTTSEDSSNLSKSGYNNVPDNLDKNIPYKLCTMKMSMNKGRIKMSCLSPNGEIVAISNEVGLRILIIDLKDLKVSQLKFEHPEIEVLSMGFMSDSALLLCHVRKGKYAISVYNINEGSLTDLDYLDFNKHVVKIQIRLPHRIHSGVAYNMGRNNNDHNGFDDDEIEDNVYQYTEVGNTWGVFYCLDGEVYVANLDTKKVLSLPKVGTDARICSVAFRDGCEHVVVFSTNFKYYLFDLLDKRMVSYDDRIIHNIPTKVINPNFLISNSFWLANTIIVHTTHNIFYIKLLHAPFNESTHYTPGHSDSGEQSDTPMYAHDVKIGVSDKHPRIIIGPRRLYSVPSVENLLYEPPQKISEPPTDDVEKNDNSTHNKENETPKLKYTQATRYSNIAKSKFIIHADLFMRGSHVNIVAFRTTLKDEVARKKRYGS